MNKNNFLTLLGSLKKKEFTGFEKYLLCFHENEKIAIQVFEYVKPYYPKMRFEGTSIEQVYLEVFGEDLKGYLPELRNRKMKKLLNAFSDLFLWLKDFLLCQKISKPAFAFEKEVIWLNVLAEPEKNQNHKYTKQLSILRQSIKESLPKDLHTYSKKMNISYLINYKLPNVKSDQDQEALPNFVNDLDVFYAVTRLKLTCELETRKGMPLKTPLTIQKFQAAALMASISPDLVKDHPLLAIYFELFQLIVNNSPDSYGKVDSLLKKFAKNISPVEQLPIIVYLQNYAAKQVRQGKKGVMSEIHKLNVFGIAQGVFTTDGPIQPTHFNNLVHAACRAGAFKWVETFIKVYGSKLESNIREETIKLGQAVVAFEQKKYKKTLSILENQLSNDLFREIRARALILRSYWELKMDEEDIIVPYCINFEHYLNRHKKNKSDSIVATLNFVQALRGLITRKKEKRVLIEEIKNQELIYFKGWLLVQAEAY